MAEAAGQPTTSARATASAELLPTGSPGPVSTNAAAPPGVASAKPSDPVLPSGAAFVEVGRHWASLKRICALAPLGDALYSAHAYGALSIDGATVTRYTPGVKPPFGVAFDWNRRGQPVKGGGAGQGFIAGGQHKGRLFRLTWPDASPTPGSEESDEAEWNAK